MPVIVCYSRFKAPAFYDDLLTIETALVDLSRHSCRFCYRISRSAPLNHRPQFLAKGYTVQASVNRDGKLTSLPDELLDKLRKFV